ncbi:hypothetical protein K9L27_02120 [Candidatus Gracilibacteria bacterium]|nr:hypothetical protein [Candidatus Gracilibacteria bacterium]
MLRKYGIPTLFLGWSVFLLWIFISSHPTYIWGFLPGTYLRENAIRAFPFLFGMGTLVTGALWLKKQSISFVSIALIFWLLFSVGMCYWGKQFHSIADWGQFFYIFRTILINILIVGGILFFSFFWGQLITPSQEKIVQFGIGVTFLSLLGLGFALMGFFFAPIWIPFILVGPICFWKKFLFFIRQTCSQSIRFSNIEIFFIGIIALITILNETQSFLPFSLGWDSMNEYFLTIKVLAEEGMLRSGILPPLGEVFLAFPAQILGISVVPFLLVIWGMIVWGTVVWLGQKLSLSYTWSMILATVFFLLPAVQFQLSRDLKVDLFFLEFVLLGLGTWIDEKKIISGFFFGISALAKLTAIWFFPIFFILTIIQKTSWKEKLSSEILLVLPLLVWGGMNFFSSGMQNASFLQILKTPSKAPVIVLDTPVSPSSFREEVGRYNNFSQGGGSLSHIFRSTAIPDTKKQYTDIGFWWGAVIPFLFFFIILNWNKISWQHRELFGFGITFFGFWLFWGEGIAWYGFPWMILFLLLSGFIFLREQTFPVGKITRIIYCNILAFSLLFGFWNRIENTFKPSLDASVVWASSPDSETADRLLRKFFEEEIIVTDILNQDLEARIFRIGTMTRFWVKDADKRIFDDAQLDVFTSLGVDNFLKLRKDGFRYVLFDQATIAIELNSKGSLHEKVLAFRHFADTNLQKIYEGNRLILFEIPTDVDYELKSKQVENSEKYL